MRRSPARGSSRRCWCSETAWERTEQGSAPGATEVAEREGFEPPVVLPTHAFQACALNHSAISPPSGHNVKNGTGWRNAFSPEPWHRDAPPKTTIPPISSFAPEHRAPPRTVAAEEECFVAQGLVRRRDDVTGCKQRGAQSGMDCAHFVPSNCVRRRDGFRTEIPSAICPRPALA
jgi:hypothetical protein